MDFINSQLFAAIAPIIIAILYKVLSEKYAIAKQKIDKVPWLNSVIQTAIRMADEYLPAGTGTDKALFAGQFVANLTKNKFDDVIIAGLIQKAFDNAKTDTAPQHDLAVNILDKLGLTGK